MTSSKTAKGNGHWGTQWGRIIRRYTQEKVNGSKTASSLGGPPGHLKLAGVQRDPRHIEEHLQANPSA